MTSFSLEGRVALVTGAARGIGLATARTLHERGASVALVDLDADATERSAAGVGAERAIGLGADVTDGRAVASAVEATVERFGGLDVCVANAGIAPAAATLRVMDPAVVERVIDVNLLGVWRTVHAALPHVVARGGQLVLVASVYAFLNGTLVGPYAVSKAGVEQLGRALRAELRMHDASASVAYFGFIDTEMVRQGFEADPLASRLERLIPGFLRTRLTPADAGAAIVAGVERRSPRIVAPKRWRSALVLRGVLGPLTDLVFERDPRLRPLLREADAEGRTPHGIVASDR